MKILLFGVSGQLGYEVVTRARALNFDLVGPPETDLDLTDEAQVVAMARKAAPEVVINCAAYTAVDKAETDRERCFGVNALGARNAALAAKEANCRLIHVSTDYVFNGEGHTPLSEDAPTAPLNVYGQSKLEGERAVAEVLGERGVIVRTSSLHGAKGANFVHTMLKLLAEREELRVVSDQFMCPTWAGWLAEVILDLARIECGGVFHACERGVTDWFHFTEAIAAFATPPGKHWARLVPVSWREYKTAARRPQYSAMDCSRLAKVLGRQPITWQEGLKAHLKELGALVSRD